MSIGVVLVTKAAVWFSVPITIPPGKSILSKEKKNNTMLKKAVCWIIQFENVIASNKSKEFNPNDVTITKTQEQQLACSFEICKWHTGIYDLD